LSNSIVFQSGYIFRQSKIKTGEPIIFERINEVNLNTFPPSFVIDHDEVIFIRDDYREKLEEFANTHNIPIVKRPEIWGFICEPFLDTEFTVDDEKRTKQILIDNGLNSNEIEEIRKKIKLTMLLSNYYAMEWVHLGLFDYLRWNYGSKKKYHWAMKIALRNYKIKPGKT